MLLVGLTGNIASGKSTVSRLLSERGATIIDADVLARRAVETGTPAYDQIVRRWGTEVLSPDGVLDRSTSARKLSPGWRSRLMSTRYSKMSASVHASSTRARIGIVPLAASRTAS